MLRHLATGRVSLAACLLALLLLALPRSVVAEEVSLAGHWEGEINVMGTALAIDVDFALEAGAWKGDISIPLQGAKDLPLAEIRVEGKEVSFKMPGVPGDPAFKGAFSEDGAAIAGTFTQGGQNFPFKLERKASPAARAGDAMAGFEAEITSAMKAMGVPGLAVALVKDDQVVYAKGFGYRDVEKKLPVTPDTLFAIGSATKAFTAFVLATLVDEGKIEWEKPVRTYIPWFRLQDPILGERLTVMDLVTHRSGLPRHDALWYNNTGATRRELVERMAFLEATDDLRARFQYNNLMYLTAGHLAEVVTGKSWEDAVRQRIFEPLGMRRSVFSVEEMQKADDFALPYEEKEDVLRRIPFRIITNMGPAGSIDSSVNELAQWLRVHLEGGRLGDRRVIGATTLADLHAAHMTTGATAELPDITPADYGLGWFVNTYRGHGRVQHGGNIDGFSALVSLFPDHRLGIAVLTNLGGTPLPELLARHAADRVLKLEKVNWFADGAMKRAQGKAAQKEAKQKKDTARRTGTKPAHALEEYAGEYENDGYGMLRVALKGGKLEATYNGIVTPLEHWHYDVFNGAHGAADDAFEDTKLNFRTDDDGNVAAVVVPLEPAVREVVFARKPDARMSDPGYVSRFVGEYELAGVTFKVDSRGNALTLVVPGQPVYDLVPGLGDRFVLKQFTVVRLRFVSDEKGAVTALVLQQPQGVFTAKRK